MEFKREAVYLVEGGQSIAAAARTPGVVEQTLFNWVKAHHAGKLTGADSKVVSAEPQRASVCIRAFSGPATGMAGDRGGDLTGAAPSAATCEPVSSPSGPRSRAA